VLEKGLLSRTKQIFCDFILEIEYNKYLKVTPITEIFQKLLSFQTFFGVGKGTFKFMKL
jgi:hypothetical protein